MKKTFILLFTISFSLSAFASDYGAHQAMKRKVLNFCEEVDELSSEAWGGDTIAPKVPVRFMSESFLDVLNSFEFSYNSEAKFFLTAQKGLFLKTLDECWPNRKAYQHLVYWTLKGSVWEGKLLGVVAHFGMFKAVSFVIGKVAKFSKWVAGGLSTGLAFMFGKHVYDMNAEYEESSEELLEDSASKAQGNAEGIAGLMQENSDNLEDVLFKSIDKNIEKLEQKIRECQESCERFEMALRHLQELKSK